MYMFVCIYVFRAFLDELLMIYLLNCLTKSFLKFLSEDILDEYLNHEPQKPHEPTIEEEQEEEQEEYV